MFLKTYNKKVLKVECNPNLESSYCFAEFPEDISKVFPHLCRVFGDAEYCEETPSLAFKVRGKKISLHRHMIMINPVRDDKEADAILVSIRDIMNCVLERGGELGKAETPLLQPDSLGVFNLLPQSNCMECGQESCMTFSVLLAQGIKDPFDCPRLDDDQKAGLRSYLSVYRRFGHEE